MESDTSPVKLSNQTSDFYSSILHELEIKALESNSDDEPTTQNCDTKVNSPELDTKSDKEKCAITPSPSSSKRFERTSCPSSCDCCKENVSDNLGSLRQLGSIETTIAYLTADDYALSKEYLKIPWDFLENIPTGPDYTSLLPNEVILNIFQWLPKSSLLKCALVCKRWSSLAIDQTLWPKISFRNRSLYKGVLGLILDRQVMYLRLNQTHIQDPAFLHDSKSFAADFESRLINLDLSLSTISETSLCMLLKRCKNLTKISLESVEVNEDVCQHLSNNSNLVIINFTMTKNLSYKCVKYLFPTLKKLKELNISWTNLSNQSIKHICRNLPATLERLNIAGCRKTLDDGDIVNIRRCCPNLRELDVSDCTRLTEATLDQIVRFKHLQSLSMSRCYSIPVASFKQLRHLETLEILDLHSLMDEDQLLRLKRCLDNKLKVNQYVFSSIARPSYGQRSNTMWNIHF